MKRLFVLVAALGACTPHRATSDKPAARCERFGQTCELAPGKLGTCVEKPSPCEADCWVCQAQH